MTNPVAEAEKIVKRARRRPGYIAAGTLCLSLVTAGLWSSPAAADGTCSMGGRLSGISVPCGHQTGSSSDEAINRLIGTTTTSCALGGLFGGLPGLAAGCVGGLLSNIPW